MNTKIRLKALLISSAILLIVGLSTRLNADTGTCGGASITLPFTDVTSSNAFFCAIAESYFSGLTNGTTAATYSPGDTVLREQMSAFVTRTLDQSLKRGSLRASLKQWWAPTSANDLPMTTVGSNPFLVESDGADLWVANFGDNSVSRVRASDGKLLETWTGAADASAVLAARGRIFVTGDTLPGRLYEIDPRQPPGPVSTLTSSLGAQPEAIAFDGSRVWTANFGSPGSVSIVTLNPIGVTTITAGFVIPFGIFYSGANIWLTDIGDGTLKKLDANGAIVQTVNTDAGPAFPVFDGINIWVPNNGSSSLTVVRASTGAILATLTGNGLNGPWAAAFDGERILVTNQSGNSVSLWKAADLTPLGSVGTGTQPFGACSDGLNFWISFRNAGTIARF